MNITYLGHAAIMMESNGVRIVMDPWLTDPTYHGSWWHYPPLALGIADLPRPDYIYISHEHPDHFDPPTLEQVDKDIPILIANFGRKRFLDRLAALGFQKIIQLDFGKTLDCGHGVKVSLIAPDRPWDDSAILFQDGTHTILNVNDCHLDDSTMVRISQEISIDLAFLTFTGASQYPGCFEMSADEKLRRLRASKAAHLEEFVTSAQLLKARRVVPAAGNYALLAPEQLHLNTSNYVNNPQEALDALATETTDIEGLQMNPGDTWTPVEGVQRLHPAPDWSQREEAIAQLSSEQAEKIAASYAIEAPAPSDLYSQFHKYFTTVLEADPDVPARIGIVTWWQVEGPAGGDWVIDFTRDKDWVYQGVPTNWNLRLTISDTLVALGVSDRAIWENIVLSSRVKLARRPDEYMKEFWAWFCKLEGLSYT